MHSSELTQHCRAIILQLERKHNGSVLPLRKTHLVHGQGCFFWDSGRLPGGGEDS